MVIHGGYWSYSFCTSHHSDWFLYDFHSINLEKGVIFMSIILLSMVIITNVFAFKQKNKIVNLLRVSLWQHQFLFTPSPDAHSQELFRLHEGGKVKIKREEGRWIEIVIANGSVGWLQKKNVETI